MAAKNHKLCPVCGKSIAVDQINVTEGVALCPSCGELSRLSEVASVTRSFTETLRRPPKGCWIIDRGDEIVVHATLRSLVGALGALFAALFWNGILSVFVLVALEGLYTNLVGPLPAWFPAPQMDDSMTLGMTLFLCVFLVPFLVIGFAIVGGILMCAAGKVEVKLRGMQGQIRTGIGPLVWRRRFDAAEATRVRIDMKPSSEGRSAEAVAIEADRTLKFGSMLTDERREWMRAALQVLLLMPSSALREELLANARNPFDDWLPPKDKLTKQDFE